MVVLRAHEVLISLPTESRSLREREAEHSGRAFPKGYNEDVVFTYLYQADSIWDIDPLRLCPALIKLTAIPGQAMKTLPLSI